MRYVRHKSLCPMCDWWDALAWTYAGAWSVYVINQSVRWWRC